MNRTAMTSDNTVFTKGKLINRYFLLVCLINLCCCFAMYVYNNGIVMYFDYLGKDTSLSGMIAIPFAIAAILGRIFGGYFTDHAGRRTMLLAAGLIFACSAMPFCMVVSVVILFILRALHGFGYSILNTTLAAANMDTAPPDQTKRASGLFFVPSALSLAFCGVVTTFFTNRDMYTGMSLTVGSALFIGVILTLFLNYEKKYHFKSTATRDESSAQYKGVSAYIELSALPAVIISVIYNTSLSFLNGFMLLFATETGIPNPGLFFTVAAILMVLLNLSSDFLQSHFSKLTLLLFTFAMFVFSYAFLALTGSAIAYYCVAVAYACGTGIVSPVLYMMALESAPIERRGAASSTLFMSNDIGVGIGSAIWGVMITAIGYSGTMLAVACVVAAAAAAAIIVFKVLKAAH